MKKEKLVEIMGSCRIGAIVDFILGTATVILFIITVKKILRNTGKNDMINKSDTNI
ncbi:MULTISPECIES: hypothetical protein [Lachnospiraceae]|jgi:hypothetical protein|uniref:Uncharacterized protein n=1 Tax=Faecalicatena acetigenes TaxID=2981790 RepID=A0ABT2TE91_9FIRM|nr:MULTISPECIES: hypothetical protein [Lachnospiraceae]MCU6748595.1 hypothetical protein [Faecalicatena acetigenes]SCI53015.1 Uncharacterised protein [uncultured Clostridium sp.]